MTGQQVASRFGQDAPSRIATSATMLSEATSTMPNEPYVPTVIPFYAGQVVTGDQAAAAALAAAQGAGPQTWERQPERLDISFRQGDDVLIPLYLQDPENPTLDMSGWEWVAQIRRLPHYSSTLVNEFTTDSAYYPPGPPPAYHPTLGTTLVQLLLPRELNDFRGCYAWEMYSIGPYDYAGFPEPADWPDDAEPWPPATGLRTWLYGLCTIRARTTDTDVLPDVPSDVIPLPPVSGWYPGYPGAFVGPNGRVP
jgi:hypothetical protein